MTIYVALLRGVNVGGKNRVAMPELRRVVESLGHEDVATYVNSGNVVFTSKKRDDDGLGRALQAAIRDQLGVDPSVLVRSAAELAKVVAANPFPAETDPKKLHAVFLPERADGTARDQAQAAQAQAEEQGSHDEVQLVDRVAYLRTTDGLGRSKLAVLLGRRVTKQGTARNWATVTKLLEMCEVLR